MVGGIQPGTFCILIERLIQEVFLMKGKFLKQFLAEGKLEFGISILFSVVEAMLTAGIGIVLQKIMDAAAYGTVTALYRTIQVIVVCFLMLSLVNLLLRRTKHHFIKRALITYKDRIFAGILGKRIHTFDNEMSGKYVSMLTNDIHVIEEKYLQKIYSLVTGVVTLITAIGIMLMYDVRMFGVTIVMCLITMLIAALVGKNLDELQAKVGVTDGKQSSMLHEMFSGFAVIKSFRAEKEIASLFAKQNRSTEDIRYRRRMTENLVYIVAMSFITGSQVVIMAFGAWMVVEEALTVGVLVAFIQLMNSIMGPAQSIPADLANMSSARQIMKQHESFLEFMEEETEQEKEPGNCLIHMEDVRFGYEEDKPILKGIDMTFEPGKSYAIVGASGSGKTTLLKLLAGELENFEGKICMDDNDYADLDFADVSSVITYIRQNNFLFDSSIKNNICMFKQFSEERVERAIELAGLREVIEQKDADFTCGENGSRLSGGEGQRVAIARGILRGTQVLLLDEATASLDAKTAEKVERALLALEGYTRIAVSHKLYANILSEYDSIIAMRDGVIEECGTYDELMEKKGYFYSLCRIYENAIPF